ncbi:MAG: hypothetical protein IPK82_06065 [Polyangiaceae bacterium]|nr:hypothetical protein [Polyangiaceae bacterium]
MSATKIIVRPTFSLPPEEAKAAFAAWARAHNALMNRLPEDAWTVMLIRGEDVTS